MYDRRGRPTRYQVAKSVAHAMQAQNVLAMLEDKFEAWAHKNLPHQTRLLIIELRKLGMLRP